MLRTYWVFNADQVSGAEKFQVTEEPATGEVQPDFAPAEELIVATGADIRHGGENAFYNLTGDYIQLPNRERFGSLGAYYETGIHELSHWSEPRQHFDRQQLGYAMCELVAEMSACFVASEIGIPHGEGLENHAILPQVVARPDEGRCQLHFPCVEDGVGHHGFPAGVRS